MNIFIVSDTHGRTGKALEMLDAENKKTRIDHIIHCGDYYRDGEELSLATGIPFTAVSGNCDPGWGVIHAHLDTPAGRILITHGYTEYVNIDHQDLLRAAEAEHCQIVCYGHTHVPVNTMENGIRVINPGSLTLPRDNSRGGSCAILTISDDGIDISSRILYYGEGGGPKKNSGKKTKKRGGFLRGLMNYSDSL